MKYSDIVDENGNMQVPVGTKIISSWKEERVIVGAREDSLVTAKNENTDIFFIHSSELINWHIKKPGMWRWGEVAWHLSQDGTGRLYASIDGSAACKERDEVCDRVQILDDGEVLDVALSTTSSKK